MFAMYVPYKTEPIHLFRTVEDSINYYKETYFIQMIEELNSFEKREHSEEEKKKFITAIEKLYQSYLKEVDDTYELFRQKKQDWFGNLEWFYIKEIKV